MIDEHITFYDPQRDLSPVDQYGFVDLKSALANSCVPSVMPGSDVDYNGMDDPAQVLGMPRDIFEAIDAQQAAEAAASSPDNGNNKDE